VKMPEWLLSKWLYYGLIFISLFFLFLYVLPFALKGNDIAANFVAELLGLLITLAVFVMFFEWREKLEWKSVEGRVKQRISRQIRGLFADLSILCDVERVLFGPFSDERFEELADKQLNTLASGDVLLHDEARKSLREKDFRLQYARLAESRETSLGQIEDKYSKFLDSEIQTSLMDIQDHLQNLNLEFRIRHTREEDFFKSISYSIGQIMKEIQSLKRKGFWVKW